MCVRSARTDLCGGCRATGIPTATGHQQDGATLRMENHDEADEDADGTPQQVGGPEPDSHTLLAINGAGRLLEPVGVFEQGCEFDLLPVLGGPALGPRAVRRRGRRREERYAVAFDARDQVVAVGQQSANNFAAGIVGVGHEVKRLLECQ